MTEEKLQSLFDQIDKVLIKIQQGELSPDTLINNKAPITKYVNDNMKYSVKGKGYYSSESYNGDPLIVDCPKCKLPMWFHYSVTHIKFCDGIPIMPNYRVKNPHWTKYALKLKEERAFKKEQRLIKKYTPILTKAVYSDSWEEYDSIIKKNKIKNRLKWLKLCGVHDIFLKRVRKMKSFKYWTTTDCSWCGIKYKISKKDLNRKQKQPVAWYHCSMECYIKNKSNIQQEIVERQWNEKYGNIATWNEWSQHKVKNYKTYRGICDDWMRHNLKKYKPDEWKYYQETDNVAIDHHYFPVSAGFKRMTPPNLTSHSDNLQVISISKNSKKHDKIYHDGMPEFLVNELNKPIILSRVNWDGPPKKQRLIDTYHQTDCVYCDKEYYVELSKADENDKYCGIKCERKVGYDNIVQSGQIEDMLVSKIPLCDWNTVIQLDKEISKHFDIPGRYITTIRQEKFELPPNFKIEQERFLIENAHNYTFPNNFFGPYEMKCNICGTVQKYNSKSSLLRVLGHHNPAYNTTKPENIGKCGDCSRTAKRDWSHVTQEYRDECTLRGLNRVWKVDYKTLKEFYIWFKPKIEIPIQKTNSMAAASRISGMGFDSFQAHARKLGLWKPDPIHLKGNTSPAKEYRII